MDGEEPAVAAAIDEHYQPRFHGDKIVENIISVVVSLAEKIDNLLGSFSVGNIPKGSQDPYALRRQAFAIIEIIIHNKLKLEISDILNACADNYNDGKDHVKAILSFITNRAKKYFQDAGITYDEIDACLSVTGFDYYEKYLRAFSLHEFRADDNFSQMLLGFKRMNNIYSSFLKKNEKYKLQLNEALLKLPAEKELFEFFNNKKEKINSLINDSKYKELFTILTSAKPVIDKFFDEVMVMDKDIKIRDSRLAVIENIINQFAALLDFSKISGE
jgi:glycyl-tRNA synthetase beta chain